MKIAESNPMIREKLNNLELETSMTWNLTADIMYQIFVEIPPERALDEEPVLVTVGDFIARRVEELSVANTKLRSILACLQEQLGDLRMEK